MSIDFYKEFGDLGYLANYSNHSFSVDGIFYKSVEHYYQASKFSDPVLVQKILSCDTPKEASIIGRDRSHKRIPNFSLIKLEKMYEGVYYKFSQNKDIRSKLIETRDEEIREMSVKESYWGVGPNLDGENHIGKILMKVRSQVREELLDEILRKCQGKKVYVLGHRRADADSCFSCCLLTHILKSYGVDCVVAFRDSDFVDSSMIYDYLRDEYEVIDDYSNKNFILVDHNVLDGVPLDSVIGCFDHHRISGEVLDLIEAEYASCTLLLYDLFKDRYSFSRDEKMLVGLGVLADTEFLTSSRFGVSDQALYDSLELEIDRDDFRRRYLNKTIFHLDIQESLLEDYKEYQYDKFVIKRSMIKSDSLERKEHYQEYTSEMGKSSINLLIWCDYDELSTYVCYQGYHLKFPYFTTSTYVVLDFLKKENILIKR